MIKMYGVKLISYSGQEFNAWIYDDNGKFSTPEIEEAYALKREYETRNPKGFYIVEEVSNE